MEAVIVVFDIGKTNKKMILFNQDFSPVYEKSRRFEEITDEDGHPCDNLDAIESWTRNEIKAVQEQGIFLIKGINFSTHGASLVYLDKIGNRITPLYNYLKPIDEFDFSALYNTNEGVDEFSRKTASPAYGMLNAGLQIYWLKQEKPNHWQKVETILHYPQYLSYLFTKNAVADYTSIGAHTAMWDFDKMDYHPWLAKEGITLPEPTAEEDVNMVTLNGQKIAIGNGLHDSTSSIISLLQDNADSGREFVLLSTGTWIIAMNPFSNEALTDQQLENNCLCFLTPEMNQIKSSMQFLGHVHEINTVAFSSHFGFNEDHYQSLVLKKSLCSDILAKGERLFFPKKIEGNFKADLRQLVNFSVFERAYYQLVFEISQNVYEGILHILDIENNLKNIYLTGGFNRNAIFIEFLSQMMPNQEIRFPSETNASALGAALLLKDHF